MAKIKSFYICKECNTKSFQWRGRCSDCGAWDSLIEEKNTTEKKKDFKLSTISLSDISADSTERLRFGISELDRVLGSGAVLGSSVLLAGDPGIGKSTLMLQAASLIANQGKKVLYLAGEESPSQIKLRSTRLNASDNILISTASGPEEVADIIEKTKPSLAIIDSIQSLSAAGFSIGSPSQLRDAVSLILPVLKKSNTACFMIGHVTKDGSIAGPKAIEHIVDVVISFEGDNINSFRLLRSSKNRFGPTDEIGVFQMSQTGLEEVLDPSGLFLNSKPKNSIGSVVVPSIQGTRPILVEIQALVSKSPLAYPRRTALGIDPNRLALLTAVLEKTGKLSLFDQDIFINIAGGLKLKETATDLGVAAAINSSYINKPISEQIIFIGEIGLSGEVRSIKHIEQRLKEAEKLGFKKAITPKLNSKLHSKIETTQINYIMDLIGILS